MQGLKKMFWRSKGLDPAAPWPRREGRGSAYWKPSRHFTKSELSDDEESRLIIPSSSCVELSSKRLQLALEPALYPPPKRQKVCDPPPEVHVKAVADSELWTEKYRPKCRSDIVGNEKLVIRLYSWLQTWETCHREGASNFKRAVLISGPPGVGKTAAAIAISEELTYTGLWVLASTLKGNNMLFNNKSLTLKGSRVGLSRRIVFIVDEMDHLDEPTVQALFSSLRRGSFPVICICNDRYSKSFCKVLGYCMELKFQKPRPSQILKLLLDVQKREKVLANQEVLKMLIDNAQRDVRQILLQMQYLCVGATTHQISVRIDAKDNCTASPFATIDSLFSEPGYGNFQPFDSRVNLILQDFEFVSLLVQENYINYKPAKLRKAALIMDAISKASDCLCFEDLMHRHQRWEQKDLRSAVLALTCSSVLQGKRIAFDDSDCNLRFPAWLRKTSFVKKTSRYVRELYTPVHRKPSTVPEAAPCKDRVVSPRNIKLSDDLFAILKQKQ